ncbi:MAG: sigma-70 family RNA polymerase sigma factor [Bacteroidales bacterium]|jgi:RNA polymerase sigma-70 factor (ECF subfamily)|nr:sigma-70 family RNA polymerase sigma factor [Bacteroidales bacterium]
MEPTGSNRINELVRQAIAGNGTAFTALWDIHIESLRMFVKNWLKNLDDLYVDDICSRSFEKAFRQIGSYDPSKSQFITWLRTIARNTALDLLEQEGRVHSQMVSIDDFARQSQMVDSLPDQMASPLESIIRDEDQVETEGYVEKLPSLYREVARKRLIEGMQYKEIAQETGLELNTVRTRIRRARAIIDRMRKEED